MVNNILDVNNFYKAITTPVKNQNISNDFNLNAQLSTKYSKQINQISEKQISNYLTSMNKLTNNLKDTANSIKSNENSLDAKGITSNNPSITATSTDKSKLGVFEVNVNSLAKSQINKSNILNNSEKSNLTEGYYQFSINSKDKNSIISLNINKNDTNKDVLSKISNSINESNSGYKSSVINDSNSQKSYLKIEGLSGKDNSFKVEDLYGNASKNLGIDNQAQSSQNASVKLNGNTYESATNKLDVENGSIQLNLLDKPSETTKLNVFDNTKNIFKKVEDTIKNFNSTLTFSKLNSSNFEGASKLDEDLTKIAGASEKALSKIGISINEDGTLSLDKNKLNQSINENSNSVKETLNSKNGFVTSLQEKSNEILNNPLSYTKSINDKSNSSSIGYNSNQQKTSNFKSGMVLNLLL